MIRFIHIAQYSMLNRKTENPNLRSVMPIYFKRDPFIFWLVRGLNVRRTFLLASQQNLGIRPFKPQQKKSDTYYPTRLHIVVRSDSYHLSNQPQVIITQVHRKNSLVSHGCNLLDLRLLFIFFGQFWCMIYPWPLQYKRA